MTRKGDEVLNKLNNLIKFIKTINKRFKELKIKKINYTGYNKKYNKKEQFKSRVITKDLNIMN
jgi:hypothetical protein